MLEDKEELEQVIEDERKKFDQTLDQEIGEAILKIKELEGSNELFEKENKELRKQNELFSKQSDEIKRNLKKKEKLFTDFDEKLEELMDEKETLQETLAASKEREKELEHLIFQLNQQFEHNKNQQSLFIVEKDKNYQKLSTF